MENLPVPVQCGAPSQQELMVFQTWAKNAFDSQMYRNVGKEAAIMMIMLAGREYGIGPAQALNGGLHIIDGKVELSSRIMSALIRRAKHTLKILESTDKKCSIYGKRSDTGEEHTVTYTIEMAQAAGLIKEKGGWKKNPEDMLFARAISRLARQLFSDVIGVGYIEGEISESKAISVSPEPIPESGDDEVQRSFDVYEIFPKEDHELLHEFIEEFKDHFKITRYQALIKLLENRDLTKEKFSAWKVRRQK